jgi:hypothetical protein
MSTTMLPPTYYVVKPRGQTAVHLPTLREAAAAILRLAPTPVRVSVMNGIRIRSLTNAELRELGQHMRAHRLRGLRQSSATAVRNAAAA